MNHINRDPFCRNARGAAMSFHVAIVTATLMWIRRRRGQWIITTVILRCGRRLWMSGCRCVRGGLSWKKIWTRQKREERYRKKEEEKKKEEEVILHSAVLRNDSNAVAVLLFEHGVDANARNQYGHTPLHAAASLGFTRIDVCLSLIRGGADPLEETMSGGCTSIDIARIRGEGEVAALLSLSTLYSV